MRIRHLPGKMVQLSNLRWPLWSTFILGWMRRDNSGIVPCVLPESTRLLQIPLREFYDSYWFFSESKRGRNELQFFLRQLRPGDILYDIGAFRGVYGAAAKAALGSAVSVYLFEPIEENFRAIEMISRVNQLQRFEIVPEAVGSTSTIRGVFDAKDCMLREGDASPRLRAVEMPATSVDLYAEETGVPPSVIKLDVDGFEMEVLEGAQKTLMQFKPRLWIELHPGFLAAQGRRWEEAIELLKSLGYTVFNFHRDYELPTRDIAFHVWCDSRES